MTLDSATVLVVDDEMELLEIFSAWLGRRDCRVLTAVNGVEALKILVRERIDVLITDIRMPVMDGANLVRAIFDMGLRVPSIIFVSGWNDVEPREMYAMGVQCLLEKPLNRKDLLDALDESLKEREELWLTPLEGPPPGQIAMALASYESEEEASGVKLGQGGCAFPSDRPLEVGQRIDLSAQFAKEGLTLKAHAVVRWYLASLKRAGAAFQYLDPSCRDWVLAVIKRTETRSFIPR